MTEDSAEFAEYFHEHAQALLRYAYMLCGNRSLAEDLVQETFLNLWKSWPSKRETIHARPGYQFKAVRNTFLSHCRQVKSEKRSAEKAQQQAAARGPEEPGDAQVVRDQIRTIIRKLPERHQEVFFLVEYAGYKPAEIASVLGLAPATVSNYLSKARNHIEQMLSGLEDSEEGRGER